MKLHDVAEEPKARGILERHGATNVHVHKLPTELASATSRRGRSTLH